MKSSEQAPYGLPMLDAELGETLRGISDCFETARNLDPHRDAWGNQRNSEFHNAVSLLDASARIGLAMAKIKREYSRAVSGLDVETVSRVTAAESHESTGQASARKGAVPPEK